MPSDKFQWKDDVASVFTDDPEIFAVVFRTGKIALEKINSLAQDDRDIAARSGLGDLWDLGRVIVVVVNGQRGIFSEPMTKVSQYQQVGFGISK